MNSDMWLYFFCGCSGCGKLIENLCLKLWRRWRKVRTQIILYRKSFQIWIRVLFDPLFLVLTDLCIVLISCNVYLFTDQISLFSELMLLGFISLLLTATSGMIANICIPSKFYNSAFAPCSRSEINKEIEENGSEGRKLLTASYPRLIRRMLNGMDRNSCKEACVIYLTCTKVD